METKKRGIKYETEKAKINMEGSEGGWGWEGGTYGERAERK